MIEKGVIYLEAEVVPWNGLVDLTEHPDDSSIEMNLYFDGNRFAFIQDAEDFALAVSSWTYPPELEPYEGMMDKQPRKPFGLSYVEDTLLHLVWNVTAQPTEDVHSSKNNELEITQFTWEFVTSKEDVPGAAPSAHMIVDMSLAVPEALSELLDWIYGTESTDPSWITPAEVVDIFLNYSVLVITDNGDGTWTATGPDEMVSMADSITFEIQSPSAIYISDEEYVVSNY